LLLLFVGASGGWGLRGLQLSPLTAAGPPPYVERAIGAHIVYTAEIRHPVEVDASQEDHLVAWLSKRLGNPLRPPRLRQTGFELVGGRLLEDAGQPAAQFMYEDDTGRRVTVYVRPHQGKETAFKFSGNRGISTFYWIDAPFAYALAGDIPRQDLLRLAHVIYEDLIK
jgi:anti-sigma factor RsiW